MKENISLSSRMKLKELRHDTTINPDLPAAVVRLDGHKFSKFCKKFKKPFDIDYRQLMVDTAKHLVKKYQCKIAYTQSDEISLVIVPQNVTKNGYDKEYIYKGRTQKICSLFASNASTYFLFQLMKRMPHIKLDEDNLPIFDARIYGLSLIEGYNSLLSRELDASKNSISMTADAVLGKSATVGVNNKEKLRLMLEEGFDWNDLDSNFKRGTYIRREVYDIKLTEEQLAKIPKKDIPKSGTVQRSKIKAIHLPPLINIENKIGFIFDNEKPVFSSSLIDKSKII